MTVNGQAPSDADLLSLVSELTLEEKISLLGGKNIWETNAVERLNIPSLKVSDGPNGARGGEFLDGTTAACFPASVSLASTFNRSLARRVGVALGQETQTKGAYVLLGPTVCPHRSPLGGRNFESFSEDPVLAGELASEYVIGLQSERVAATVKHFAANEQETKRFTVDETVSEKALREIYLKPFEIVVKKADPWAFMTSYPKVNGAYVDAQSTFITDILRNEWKYDGLVMSDWASVSNHVESIKYGLDLEMPGPPKHRSLENVKKAVEENKVDVKDIDKRVLANLKLLRNVGKFTDRRETPKEQAVDLPEHRALVREAGAEGIVLLKNENNTLPLDKSKLKKVAILGPLAKYAAAHGGGSASLNAHYKVTPFDALKQSFGDNVELNYSKGAHIFRVYPDLADGTKNQQGQPGFTCDFFKSDDLSGSPFHTENYPRGAFMTLMNEKTQGARTARFVTSYTPPESGNHYFSFSGLGHTKLFINGDLVHEQTEDLEEPMLLLLSAHEEERFQYEFDAAKTYDIVIESKVSAAESDLHIMNDQIAVHVGLITQAEMEADLLNEAVGLAKEADLAICFVGNNTQWESEGLDMAQMVLPVDGSQDKLVAEVAKANKNTVVVVTTGVPVELPWLESVPAVMQAWYAGQETGNAISDVLTGQVNPGGKLPVSWPRKYEHSPCYGNFGLDSFKSKKVEYVEGVNVGYRHFDKHYDTPKEVLFPFGHGLSYTSFELSNASISGTINATSDDPSLTVSVSVTNTGSTAGSEIVQVYLSPPSTSGEQARPPKALAGFDKVSLQAGETRTVQVQLGRTAAAYWDAASWKIDGGSHTIAVSTSSSPRDVKAKLELNIDSGFTWDP